MMEPFNICPDFSPAFLNAGSFNECYTDVMLQAGVTLLAVIVVLIGILNSSQATRVSPSRRSQLDVLRALLLFLLLLVPAAEACLGFAGKADIRASEAFGALCRALMALILLAWRRWEISRSLREVRLPLQLLWLLSLGARAILIYSVLQGAPVRKLPLTFLIGEVALAGLMFIAHIARCDRALGEPLLSSSAAGVSLADAGVNVEAGGYSRTTSTREASPEEVLGTLGVLSFSWFTPIVDLAAARDLDGGKLDPSDVYPLCQVDNPRGQLLRLEREWQAELQNFGDRAEPNGQPAPSLYNAMKRTYWKEVVATAWIKLFNDSLHFVGPFLLNKIIRYAKEREDGVRGHQHEFWGYFYAVTMVMSSFFQAFLMAHYFQKGYRSGMRMRSALILMAYKKALRVLPWPTPPRPAAAPAAANSSGTVQRRCCKPRPAAPKPMPGVGGMGQMTNLISADTDKFTFLMPYYNLIWSAPLQLVICFSMLFAYVSWALFAGILVMAAFTMISGKVQQKASAVQKIAMAAKDERLKLEVEMLKIVKVIKLYGWELTIEKRVQQLRDKEMKLQLRYKLWSTFIFLSFSLSPTMVALGTFSFYTLVLKHPLDAATAFTALSLFNILTFPLGAMPMMLRFFAEAKVAKDRLEAFFLAPEVSERPAVPQEKETAVKLKASKLCWPDGTRLLLNVDLSIQLGEIVAIVGKTGVGKSGLLFAMLGELPIDPTVGKVHLRGSIGYCAQNAWIRNTTLRDNITGGARADEDRYEAVLDACALRADLQVLPAGDQTVIGDRGINLSGGQKQRVALARAVFADPDVYILDDVLSALDSHVASHICEKLLKGPLLKGKTVVLVTHSRKALPIASRIVAVADDSIKFIGSYQEYCAKGFIEELAAEKEEKEEETQEKAEKVAATQKVAAAPQKVAASPQKAATGGEERRSGAVSWKVYGAYASACGGVFPVGVFLLSVAMSEGSRNLADVFLTRWSSQGGAASGVVAYALSALAGVACGMFYIITRVFVGQKGSKTLHEKVVFSLLRAKMSFYDLTPTGSILNRLAEDTNILDYNLPQTLAANLVWFWRAAAIVVVCMLVSWYLLFLALPMFLFYFRLAKRYLPATRDLRRLDAAARSPIFSHFAETMAGVSTVRAMAQQDRMFNTNVQKLERQMEAYYLSNTAARWLSLRLQVNGTLLVGAVCFLGIYFSSSGKISSAVLGLAISYALKLTDTLNQVNRESADRETQMVSVERVCSYINDIAHEPPLRTAVRVVPDSWPSRGMVSVQDVQMRYRDGLPLVLNGISIEIKEGERVGIVGRTGCGKSSFLMVLMRLLEVQHGRILVDDVDIASVGLHDLREKTAIIPQDPAILTGTVRFNLDPFGLKSSQELWVALEKAQLKERVERAEGGLDSKVEEGGGNYSVGELQLMCLARALLRCQTKGGMLLLDEATSALDAETDKTIQTVIRAEFKCTVITIAHRIQTLLDYDKVVVLDAGRVVECDSPVALLKKPSIFQSLAKEGGVVV